MPEHIVLIYNMGHCGGRWLQDVCNIHEDVQMWQEANHLLKVGRKDDDYQLKSVYDFFMAQYSENSKKVIGLIKAFDERLINFCIEKGGTIFQMFRNPIDIIEAKNGQKMNECVKRGTFKKIESEKEIFEAHVDFYAFRYRRYLDRQDRYPIVKLEDLNYYLRKDIQSFKSFFKTFFKIELTDRHIKSIKELSGVTGDLSRAYVPNNKDIIVYQSWKPWKQNIFLKYFKEIMLVCGYKWE